MPRARSKPKKQDRRAEEPAQKPLLPAVALGAVFCLIALANLAPMINNDVHTQIRVGADIVSTGAIPHVETYSATAAGRLFTAHEWLASVVFYGLDKLGGARALCLLQVAAVLACMLLLWRSLAESRWSTVPLLVLCGYLISWRAAVRPHLFSLVALAAVIFALERWRRGGGWRQLWWLVPMQAVWINLHGEAPLGPAVVGLMACGAALLALMGDFDRKRVVQLAVTAAAMAAACLVNPYGVHIFQFSGKLASDAYIRDLVWEWRPPLASDGLASAATFVYCAWLAVLALLWVGLAVRAFRKPRKLDALVFDILLAAFATVLSLQANRFVAYAALCGFPIIARSLEPLTLRCRPLIELSAACALGLAVVSGGLPAGLDRVKDRRPFGWGYGENMPFEEVAFIRENGLEGPIYNEYPDGALIIRELAPKVRPVMDSRIDIYGAALMDEYSQSFTSAEAFRAYLAKYEVKLVLCELRESNRALYEALRRDPAWRQVHRFHHRFLFERAL